MPKNNIWALWQLMTLDIRRSWAAACDSIGQVAIKIGTDRFKNDVMSPGLVSQAYGFALHAVDVRGEFDGRKDLAGKSGASGGAWCRYLCDHATKVQQEAIGKGRQWGIVGRKGFRQLLPSEVVKLTDSQYARFRRAFERLATASVRCPESVFGSKLGYRVKRGRLGRAVSFSQPQTIKRLLTWATLGD